MAWNGHGFHCALTYSLSAPVHESYDTQLLLPVELLDHEVARPNQVGGLQLVGI
jgi:hypothetical protein